MLNIFSDQGMYKETEPLNVEASNKWINQIIQESLSLFIITTKELFWNQPR